MMPMRHAHPRAQRRGVRRARPPFGRGIHLRARGPVEIHTEFYDPIVLETGESIYIDCNMGHAYIAPKGCEEALVLGVCSSADDELMESLMTLHADEPPAKGKANKRLTTKR